MTPAQIGELTDRQIHELYFHERDEDGSITPPAELPRDDSLLAELAALDHLAGQLRMPQAELQRLKAELRAKWSAKQAG